MVRGNGKDRLRGAANVFTANFSTRRLVTTVLVGASSSKQLLANLGALKGAPFTEEELGKIEKILGNAKVILR